MKKNSYRINNSIDAKTVRVVTETSSEIMTIFEALQQASKQSLDLIEIAPNAQPPVVKIADFQKFLYQQTKNNKPQKQKEVKTMQFGPQTDEHDFNFKLKHIKNFLLKGHSVKTLVFFKGRSITYKEQGEIILLKVASELEDICKVEKLPKLEGKRMIMLLSPKIKK